MPSKADGSLKSLDSSFDLVNLLKHEIRDGQLSFRGKRVLEVCLIYTSNTFCGLVVHHLYTCISPVADVKQKQVGQGERRNRRALGDIGNLAAAPVIDIGKHCRSFESLRLLSKTECERVFRDRGCSICLNIFSSRNALRAHRDTCQLSCGNNGLLHRFANLGIQDDLRIDSGKTRAVALACKMVGGGSDGSLDLCAKVCIIDEYENILFRSYVKPHLPVTNYKLQVSICLRAIKQFCKYETTGIRPEYLRDAMPLRHVQRKIQDFLCNGEPIWKIRPRGGKARILVGHGLDHDLKCLELEYPVVKIRDTATYPLLMKTSKLSNSLKYLTKAYLGYDIQIGIQDPYDDSVATMRLYRRMRSQAHRNENYPLATDPQNKNNFSSWRQSELERMSLDELLAISRVFVRIGSVDFCSLCGIATVTDVKKDWSDVGRKDRRFCINDYMGIVL